MMKEAHPKPSVQRSGGSGLFVQKKNPDVRVRVRSRSRSKAGLGLFFYLKKKTGKG